MVADLLSQRAAAQTARNSYAAVFTFESRFTSCAHRHEHTHSPCTCKLAAKWRLRQYRLHARARTGPGCAKVEAVSSLSTTKVNDGTSCNTMVNNARSAVLTALRATATESESGHGKTWPDSVTLERLKPKRLCSTSRRKLLA